MAATLKVKIVKGFKIPNKQGKYYRLLCLTGKNKGTSYYLQGQRIVIGRSEKADIPIADSKSSREHAELSFLRNEYVITDLGSQNGIVVNDLKVAQHQLNNGDKVIIGQTVYKYDYIINKRAELSIVENGEDDGEIDLAEEVEDPQVDEKKNKRIIIIIALGALFYFFMSDDGEDLNKDNARTKKAKKVTDNFAEKLIAKNREEDQEQQKKLEIILKRGLREYREENFFRAMHEFNLALILSPDNSRAQFYLNKSQQRLTEVVDSLSEKGQREMEANKYLEAQVTYCSVLRLYKDYPDDESYKAAGIKIEEIEKELGYLKGELKCFTERGN